MREWITGRNPVFELLSARRRQSFRLWVNAGSQEKGRLAEILALARIQKLQVENVPRSKLDPLGENHQGVAVETSAYPYVTWQDIVIKAEELKEPLFILALDLIQNPQNLGNLIRTAEAVGVHGILIPLARSATITPAVVTSSAGASEHLLIAQTNLAQSFDELKQAGAWVIGLEHSQDAQPPEKVDLKGPLILVVGSEGEGLRQLVRKSCDLLLDLPLSGRITSLNAAVAGSIALYMAYQARRSMDDSIAT
jgi:23S rRNA (guanosine2251-2'-O)-methyltransferase